MDDVVFIFQGLETHDRRECDLPQDVFRDAITVQLVNGAAVHKLHADVDGAFLEERTIEVDNEGRDAPVEDVEFHNDGGEFGLI